MPAAGPPGNRPSKSGCGRCSAGHRRLASLFRLAHNCVSKGVTIMVARLFLCAFAAASVLNAADLPYAGKWKMNPAKSDFGGTTFTYTSLPSGEWEYSADGQTYKFRMDQKDYPDGMGSTASWKPLDAATWQTVWKLNGKLLFTDTLKLTADAKNLTINTKGTKPNGNPIDTTTAAQRISGGPGLAGKWKTSNVKTSSPSS